MDELSLHLAMQLQQEEKQRAERHKRRQDEFIRHVMMQEMSHDSTLQEQMQLQKALEESKKSNPNPDNMTYEEMLDLGEKLGKVQKGFTEELIKKIPKKKVM